jgi:hypothetical protein
MRAHLKFLYGVDYGWNHIVAETVFIIVRSVHQEQVAAVPLTIHPREHEITAENDCRYSRPD